MVPPIITGRQLSLEDNYHWKTIITGRRKTIMAISGFEGIRKRMFTLNINALYENVIFIGNLREEVS